VTGVQTCALPISELAAGNRTAELASRGSIGTREMADRIAAEIRA
jgi:hypothetical protein